MLSGSKEENLQVNDNHAGIYLSVANYNNVTVSVLPRSMSRTDTVDKTFIYNEGNMTFVTNY